MSERVPMELIARIMPASYTKIPLPANATTQEQIEAMPGQAHMPGMTLKASKRPFLFDFGEHQKCVRGSFVPLM